MAPGATSAAPTTATPAAAMSADAACAAIRRFMREVLRAVIIHGGRRGGPEGPVRARAVRPGLTDACPARSLAGMRHRWSAGLVGAAAILLAAPGCSGRPGAAPSAPVAAAALQFIADDYSKSQD